MLKIYCGQSGNLLKPLTVCYFAISLQILTVHFGAQQHSALDQMLARLVKLNAEFFSTSKGCQQSERLSGF